MRNATLCVIITTALQRLNIQVFLIAQLHMGRSIFANAKIPENYFVQFVLFELFCLFRKLWFRGENPF